MAASSGLPLVGKGLANMTGFASALWLATVASPEMRLTTLAGNFRHLDFEWVTIALGWPAMNRHG